MVLQSSLLLSAVVAACAANPLRIAVFLPPFRGHHRAYYETFLDLGSRGHTIDLYVHENGARWVHDFFAFYPSVIDAAVTGARAEGIMAAHGWTSPSHARAATMATLSRLHVHRISDNEHDGRHSKSTRLFDEAGGAELFGMLMTELELQAASFARDAEALFVAWRNGIKTPDVIVSDYGFSGPWLLAEKYGLQEVRRGAGRARELGTWYHASVADASRSMQRTIAICPFDHLGDVASAEIFRPQVLNRGAMRRRSSVAGRLYLALLNLITVHVVRPAIMAGGDKLAATVGLVPASAGDRRVVSWRSRGFFPKAGTIPVLAATFYGLETPGTRSSATYLVGPMRDWGLWDAAESPASGPGSFGPTSCPLCATDPGSCDEVRRERQPRSLPPTVLYLPFHR